MAEVEAMRRLDEAAMTGNVASLVQLLHEHPLLLHRIIIGCSRSETPLHIAAMLGHTDFVRELLVRNHELALELDTKGRSPLHLASAKGYIQIVEMFLAQVEPHHICVLKDDSGRTPLHLAVIKGRDILVKELIGAHPESARLLTYEGETVLHLAVKHKRLDTLKLLLGGDHAGDVADLLNYKDSDGNTILHLAVEQKQAQIVKYVVEEHTIEVEINALNNNGCTPLDMHMLLQSRYICGDVEIGETLGNSGAVRGRREMHSHIPATTTTNLNMKSTKKRHHHNDDWVNNMRSALMVVASLIATMTFPAGISRPGEVPKDRDKYQAFVSIYYVYISANTIAFNFSLGMILLLISGFPLRRKLFMWVLMMIMWVSIFSLACTYSIASVLVVPPPIDDFHQPMAPSPSPSLGPTDDTDDTGDLSFIPEMTYKISFRGLILLLVIVFLGNIFRLVVWLVRKCKRAKDKRVPTTSIAMDGNV